MNITVGTPTLARGVASGSSGTNSARALRIHSLAPNNLDAGAAFRGLPVGVATVGTVVSTGRTGGGAGSGVNSNANNLVNGLLGTTGTNSIGTTIGNRGPIFATIPTAPGTALINNTGGIPGLGGVVFNNLPGANLPGAVGSTIASLTGSNGLGTGVGLGNLSNTVGSTIAGLGGFNGLGTGVGLGNLSTIGGVLTNPSTLSSVVATNGLTGTGLGGSGIATNLFNNAVNTLTGLPTGTLAQTAPIMFI